MKYKNARIVKLNDWHIPFQDHAALTTAISFTKSLNPDILVIDEIIDFYAISKFDKDPKRKLDLQKEIDETLTYLNILRKIFQKTRIIMLNSNHLDRLAKFLRGRAPELYYLKSLEIRELFKLDKFKIEFLETYVHNGIFIFKHGDLVRKHSGASAKAEFEKEGMSGVSGHVHRSSVYNVTKRGGRYIWAECGCLCRLDQEYITGVPDWQHGLVCVDFVDDKFLLTPYSIVDGEMILNRKIITGIDVFPQKNLNKYKQPKLKYK